MKTKLKPYICYIAGMQSMSSEAHSAVGIRTSISEIEGRFVELCLKDLGVDPKRIIVEDERVARHIYFYHSGICRRIRKVVDDSNKMFKYRNIFSSSYVAGMFDAAGRMDKKGISIRGLGHKEELVLEQLGIHTKGGFILNPGSFITLVRGFSVLLELTHLPGNERDPR